MRALRSYWSYYSKRQLACMFVLIPAIMALTVVLATHRMRLIWCVTALYLMEEVTMSGICCWNTRGRSYLLSSSSMRTYFNNIFRTDMVIKTIYVVFITFVCSGTPGTKQITIFCLGHLWLLLSVLCVRFFGKNSAFPVFIHFVGMFFFNLTAYDNQFHMVKIWWLLAFIDIGLTIWGIRVCEKRIMEGYYD